MTREIVPEPVELTLSGPRAVHDAVTAARSFAERAGIDEATRSRLAIVVEELVMNLYDHGGLDSADAFELALRSAGDELNVSLVARGPRFDPSSACGEPSSKGAGAGLKLVHAWSSRFEHEYADGRNRSTVTFPLTGR